VLSSEGRVKVLVCGSRGWWDYVAIRERLRELADEHMPLEVIHGGARGADYYAGLAARTLGVTEAIFRPDYDRHSPAWAPKARNLQMLDERPDLVLAFQLNGSRGTQHTIDEARKRGIPVEVYTA
jgi:hypothetical protein